jgi:hypothetical protein
MLLLFRNGAEDQEHAGQAPRLQSDAIGAILGRGIAPGFPIAAAAVV